MRMTITDTAITSDPTARTARHAPDRNGWDVSWLPGQTLDRNTAITAMVLADTAAEPGLHDGHRLWPHVQDWAQEPGLTAPGAITRAAQPPAGTTASTNNPVGSPTVRQPTGRRDIETSELARTTKRQLAHFP